MIFCSPFALAYLLELLPTVVVKCYFFREPRHSFLHAFDLHLVWQHFLFFFCARQIFVHLQVSGFSLPLPSWRPPPPGSASTAVGSPGREPR